MFGIVIDFGLQEEQGRGAFEDGKLLFHRNWPYVYNLAKTDGASKVKDTFAAKQPLSGWEVDAATRAVIEKAGYGDQYTHRTGHNIGQEVHGNGAHIDGLETRDDRRIIRRTCFSIEPGIYLKDFGVRSEVDVYIDAAGKVLVTGGEPQSEVHRIIV